MVVLQSEEKTLQNFTGMPCKGKCATEGLAKTTCSQRNTICSNAIKPAIDFKW